MYIVFVLDVNMKKPKVFGFYGKSSSGKTRLLVDIIKRLTSDGLNVASIKISDKKLNLDTKGKDTWKHAKAGSKLVVFSSQVETDFLIKKNEDTKKIIDQIIALDDFDVILIEGANDDSTQKIRLGNINERKNTILTYNEDFEQLINLIKK